MTQQYNFKIDTELKEKLEEELERSTADNKTEFLSQMLQAYQIHATSNIDIDIDFSSINDIELHTKEAISKAFNFILKTIQQNTSNVKQEHIEIDFQKKELQEKEELQKAEFERIKFEYLEKFNTLQEKNKNLFSSLSQKDSEIKELQIELDRASKMAEQVEFISGENSSIRLELKGLLEEKKDIEASAKKAIEKVENEKKDIQTTMKKELHSVQVELKSLHASHKKEILNIQEHIKVLEKEHLQKVSTLNETILKSSFEIEKKNETILRIEKNNVELEKNIKSLSSTHTKDIQSFQKKYDIKIASMRKELDSTKQELYISIGKLEVLEQKETQKVTSTKKEEKSLFDNEKKK